MISRAFRRGRSPPRAPPATGNLAFDAQIVAVCREHGVSTLLTDDRDFSRFQYMETVGLEKDPSLTRG